jgi:hypothetical protein
MLLLLSYIYMLLAKTAMMDVYLYTSEILDEGITLRDDKLVIGKDPTLFRMERNDDRYFIKSAKGDFYLAISDSKLIKTKERTPWIIRKNELVSDKRKINHYQFENSSRCLSKADHVLSATTVCSIERETQLFFIAPANDKLDKKKVEEFISGVMKTFVRLASEKEGGIKIKSPEITTAKADLYEILIERKVDVKTQTVELNKIASGAELGPSRRRNRRAVARKINRMIRNDDMKRLEAIDYHPQSKSLSRAPRQARRRRNVAARRRQKAARASRSLSAAGSESSEAELSTGKGRAKREASLGDKVKDAIDGLKPRGLREKRGGEGRRRGESESSDYSDIKGSREDDLLMRDSGSSEESGAGASAQRGQLKRERRETANQFADNIKREASAKGATGAPGSGDGQVVLTKSVVSNRVTGIPGNMVNQIGMNVPAYNNVQQVPAAATITVPAKNLAAQVPNSPSTQPQINAAPTVASPFQPPTPAFGFPSFGNPSNFGR